MKKRENPNSANNKRPIKFLVEDLPFEFLNGEEKSKSSFVSKHRNQKGDRIILRRSNDLIMKKIEKRPHIIPWNLLKSIILKEYLKEPKASKVNDDNGIKIDDYYERLMEANSGSYPIILHHGFPIIRRIKSIKTPFRNVYFMPSSNVFAALDSYEFHLWKGNNVFMNVSLAKSSSGNGDLKVWTYIDRYQINVCATKHLQLKILDSFFSEQSSILTSKPVICLEYSQEKDVLISGEVGSIKVWTIKVHKFNSKLSYHLEQKLEIKDFHQGEWVSCLRYDASFNRIFAGCDNSLRVYEYETGELFDIVHNIHDLSLTCVEYYEPTECIITAGRDGCIKIWNRNRMVYNFSEHFNSVTGLVLMEHGCRALPGSMPLLLSSSLDCTVRMWNFETGQYLSRLDFGEPILGIRFLKKDIIYIFSAKQIYVIDVQSHQVLFAFFRSTPIMIERYESPPLAKARIISSCSDGSIKIISPVTGATILTLFPAHKDVYLKELTYNAKEDRLFYLCTNGDIVVYDTSTCPGRIIKIFEASASYRINCLIVVNNDEDPRGKYDRLLVGTLDGQIVYLINGKPELFVQAHIGLVLKLLYDETRQLILSAGSDGVVKVWNFSRKTNFTPKDQQFPLHQSYLAASYLCTFPYDISCPPSFSISKNSGELVISYYGSVLTVDYLSRKVMAPETYIKEANLIVTHIARLDSLSIWAMASADGFVKIKHGDGQTVRELEFPEKISSLCFANSRGDLLIGQPGQIILYKMQNYLPPKYLINALKIGFEDDQVENRMDFDAQVEFWDYSQILDQKKNAESEGNWHVVKNNINKDPVKFIENQERLTSLLNIPSFRADLIRRKRIRKKFLDMEMNLYNASRHAQVMKGGQELDWKNGDQPVRTGSENLYIPFVRPGSPGSEPLIVPTSVCAYVKATHMPETNNEVEATMEIFESPLHGSSSSRNESILIESAYIWPKRPFRSTSVQRRRSTRLDIALPNSQIRRSLPPKVGIAWSSKKDTGENNPESQTEPTFYYKFDLLNSAKISESDAATIPNILPRRSYDIYRRESKTSTREEYQRARNIIDLDDVAEFEDVDEEIDEEKEEEEEDQDIGTTENHIENTEIKPKKASKAKTKAKRKSKIVNDVKLSNNNKRNSVLEDTKDKIVLPKTVNDGDNIDNNSEPITNNSSQKLPRATLPNIEANNSEDTRQNQKRLATSTTRNSQSKENSSIVKSISAPKKDITYLHKNSIILNNTESNAGNQIESISPDTNIKSLGPQFRKERISIEQRKEAVPIAQNIPSAAGNTQSDTQSSDEIKNVEQKESVEQIQLGEDNTSKNIILDPMISITIKKNAKKISWQYLKNIHQSNNEQNQSLNIFHALEDLTNQLRYLKFLSVRYAKNYEKCEAAKKILCFYETFKNDFTEQNAFNLFIRPHLDMINDSSAIVRAQVCYNLAANDQVLAALISALDDPDPSVVQAAISSLSKYGINNREKLKEEMLKLGFFPHTYSSQSSINWLDILLEKQKLGKVDYKNVKKWLETIKMKKLNRADSFVDHLVCPDDFIIDEVKYARYRHFTPVENATDSASERERRNFDPCGWEINGSADQPILLEKRASTSHIPHKKKNIQRAKTSPGMARLANVAKKSQSPVLSRRKISTPSEQAWKGARCFLSAYSSYADPKLPLMNLMGNQKKESKNSKTSDKNIEIIKRLSNSYLDFCKVFSSSPLPQIINRLENAIENGGKCEQMILSSIDLNSANISAISECFKEYTELALFSIWNSSTPFHIIKLLGQFYEAHPSLKIIQLINCEIRSESCAILCNVARVTRTITDMELDHNPLGESVLYIIQSASLNESGSLRRLGFRFCSLQDTPKLLSDVFFSMKNITSLNLNGNNLGDSGLITICRSLTGNQSLEQLYLQANRIQNLNISGVYPMEIVRSVFSTVNTTLNELDLSLNFIDEIGSKALLDTIKDRKNTSKNKLKISISERVSNEVFSKVWTLTGGASNSKGKGKKSKKKK